jgi:hypothetical protein
LPSPQQNEEEKSLRERFEAVIDELQKTVEGRQTLGKPSISGVLQQLVEESKKQTEKTAAAEFMSIQIADAFLPEGWQARQDRCAISHKAHNRTSVQITFQMMKHPILHFN